jgi:hypothetical protein
VPNRTCSHLPATVIIEAYSAVADAVSQAIIIRKYAYIIVIDTHLRIRSTHRAAARAVREQFDATKTVASPCQRFVSVVSTADAK